MVLVTSLLLSTSHAMLLQPWPLKLAGSRATNPPCAAFIALDVMTSFQRTGYGVRFIETPSNVIPPTTPCRYER